MATAKKTKSHIVIIDEDQDFRNIISAFFRQKGFEVSCFSEAETALKDSLRSGRDWGVLLTNLHSPKISGIELTAQLKANLPQLPVILIAPHDSIDLAAEAVRQGAYDFLVKPINYSLLQVSIERALHLNNLKEDISELRQLVKSGPSQKNNIIGRSPKFLAALDIAKRVARSTASIFITGESGTGKEVLAKFIHHESGRGEGPFVAINCSAIPEQLLESELFGHAKGAFTGAQDKKIGLFEEAENGTLFLDEIGDLSLPLQAKLLRVLQEKKIKRVGENQLRDINCRIISATHKDLSAEVKTGRFREDLFFRLDVIPIQIPPLRQRPEDILPLAEFFLRHFSLENASPAKTFSKEAVKFLMENPWRGNVRELENTVERAVVLCDQSEIALKDFMPLATDLGAAADASQLPVNSSTFYLRCTNHLPSLDEVIQKYIEFAVARKAGARDKTAKEIGIDRKTLYKWLKPETNELQS